MARLTRKNIKVFAGNATDNGVFGSLQANNPTTTSDVEQIQSLSAWSEGWNSATETSEMLPPLEEFQGVQYVTTYQQAYLMQEGIPEWAATVTYYKGCLAKEVTSTGFRIYNSLTDNNTGNILSDTSNWKKVMDSEDLYAFDNTVVHLSGNETITGAKTFQGTGWITFIKDTNVTYNTAPSSDTTTTIAFVDKNSQNMGVVECVRAADNATRMQLNVCGPNGSWASQSLQLRVDANGNSYAYAPAPTDTTSTSSKEIATVGWVNSANNNVVHRTGNETITGFKTFNNDISLGGVAGSGQEGGQINFNAGESETNQNIFYLDRNDGQFRFFGMDTNGTMRVPLRININNNLVYANPSDVSNTVVTTTGISKSGNGYVKLGNGIIIQWGWHSGSGSTLTFPTPFTSTNYSVTANYRKQSSSGSGIGHVNFYPTSTTSCYFNSQGGDFQWIAIGY